MDNITSNFKVDGMNCLLTVTFLFFDQIVDQFYWQYFL